MTGNLPVELDRLKPLTAKRDIPTVGTFAVIVASIASQRKRFSKATAAAVQLLAATGLLVSEARALRWKDIGGTVPTVSTAKNDDLRRGPFTSFDHGGPKSKVETRHYIANLKDEKAGQLQKYIRNHWAIENNCHWVLDTLFRDDHNQTRQKDAAKNLSTLRRIAHNTLMQAPDHGKRKPPSSLPEKQLRAANDETYLEQCLSLV